MLERVNVPEKDELIVELLQAEKLMARIASKLQRHNNVPKVRADQMKIALSQLRERFPLAFRGVVLSAPLVGKGNIEFKEINDNDYLKLNK